MAETPRARPDRLVIPLFPERATEKARFRLPLARFAPLLALVRGMRVPAEVALPVRESARGGVRFLAPAVLLATGVALLAVLLGSVASALGMDSVDVGGIAATAGLWTLLASAGGALAWRGFALARARWR